MGSGGGGSSSATGPYDKGATYDFLKEVIGSETLIKSVTACFNDTYGTSPYVNAEYLSLTPMFGEYGDTPTIYDMYGKFMAGLDVEYLWLQIYEGTVSNPEVDAAIVAHSVFLQDEIDTRALPQILAGMRDINSVMSSTFVNAKALLQESKLKSVNKFSSELKIKLIDIANQRWQKHLAWNETVTKTYADLNKLYLSAHMDLETMEMDFKTKDALFNIRLYEYLRVVAMYSGGIGGGGTSEPSQSAKAVSGALSGAAMGAMIPNPLGPAGGAAAGAVVGLAASFL